MSETQDDNEPLKNRESAKDKLEPAIHLTTAIGETRSSAIAILELVEKSEKALDHIANLPVIKALHFVAMAISGIALLLKVIKQSLFLFTLKSDARRIWWDKKSIGSKIAYVLKTILAVAIVGLAVSSIFVPASAVILIAASYIAASLQNFVDFFKKFPKILGKLDESSENCRNLETTYKNENNETNRLKLESAKNERAQHRLAAISQGANAVFNTIYIVAAILTIFIPPVGAIILGITALTNIVFGVSTLIAGKSLKKKSDAINKQQHKSGEEEKIEIVDNNEQRPGTKNIINQGQHMQETHEHPNLSTEDLLKLELTTDLHCMPSLPGSEKLHDYKNHIIFAEDEEKYYRVDNHGNSVLVADNEIEKIKIEFKEKIKQQKATTNITKLESENENTPSSTSQHDESEEHIDSKKTNKKIPEETKKDENSGEGEGGNEPAIENKENKNIIKSGGSSNKINTTVDNITEHKKQSERHEPNLFKHDHPHLSTEALLSLELTVDLHFMPSLPEVGKLSDYKNHIIFAEDQEKYYHINSHGKPMPVDNNELEKIKEKFKGKLTKKDIEANSMSALNMTQNESSQANQPFQHAKSKEHIKNNNGVEMPEEEGEREGDEGDGRSEGEKETEKEDHDNDNESPSSGL